MSVLYQALKRRDEVERAGAPGGGSMYINPPRTRGGLWSLLVTVLILLVAAAYAYIFFLDTDPVPIMPQPAAILAPATLPLTARAEAPSEIIDDATPVTITDAAQIAAMLPAQAQIPLPVPPVKVGSDASPQAVQERARQLQAQGATDAALKLYTQAGDDFSSRVNRWGLIAESDAPQALPHLKALVRERPDNAAAHAQLGLAYIKLNRLDDAKAELLTATSLDTTNAQIWYNLAALADQMGDSPVAQNAYQNALLHAGDAPPFDRAIVQRRLNYLRGR
ncbi:MAG: tetratricopeptide repeat protein [Bdellovibrionales bacterium]